MPEETPSVQTVQSGQVWEDVRAKGRTLRVDSFETHLAYRRGPGYVPERFARCTILTDGAGTHRSQIGKTTLIRLDRLRPTRTGYRLLSNPETDHA